MRVVLDTNLLLSSLISRGSVPDQVYRAWEGGRFELELVPYLRALHEAREALFEAFGG